MDDIAAMSKPVIILTGGEPLLRSDLFDLAQLWNGQRLPDGHGDQRHPVCRRNRSEDEGLSGIQRISISLDGPDAESHDAFRKVKGSFEGSLHGIEKCKKGRLEFQINTTITQINLHLDPRHSPACGGPRGRSPTISSSSFPPEGERNFKTRRSPPKTTRKPFTGSMTSGSGASSAQGHMRSPLLPHSEAAGKTGRKEDDPARIRSGRHDTGMPGRHFLLLYFACRSGSTLRLPRVELRKCEGKPRSRRSGLTRRSSRIFAGIDDYQGKCGRCEFRKVCGGCRARAYEISGDYMAEEPYCIYEPLLDPSSAFGSVSPLKFILAMFLLVLIGSTASDGSFMGRAKIIPEPDGELRTIAGPCPSVRSLNTESIGPTFPSAEAGGEYRLDEKNSALCLPVMATRSSMPRRRGPRLIPT